MTKHIKSCTVSFNKDVLVCRFKPDSLRHADVLNTDHEGWVDSSVSGLRLLLLLESWKRKEEKIFSHR